MADSIEAAGALATAGLAARALDQPRAGADGHHPTQCANCGAMLSGAFCAQCGQRAHLHRSVGDVFHEFLHGITHFDGKAWTTLPMLLFRPGKLIRSYIEGQRARYIAPVPTFLLVVFTMFFVLSFAGFKDNVGPVVVKADAQARAQASDEAGLARALADIDAGIKAAKAAGDTKKLAELEAGRRLITAVGVPDSNASITERLSEEIIKANERGEAKINFGVPWLDAKAKAALKNPKLLLYKLQTKAYKLSFLLVPMSMPWLWLVFFWRRHPDGQRVGQRIGMYDHAIFALYSISFISLLFIVGSLLLSADIVSEFVWVPLLLAPGAHMFASLRGAYSIGIWGAGWRTAYLSIAAMLTLSLYLVLLVVLGVLD
jgi:hypothetical protein